MKIKKIIQHGCPVFPCFCALLQVEGAPSHEEDKVPHKDKPMRWHCGFPNKVL